jgi:hypothetical protein
MHFLTKKPKKSWFFQEETKPWFFGFLGFFPAEGIASDATCMYYVKTKKPIKPKKPLV